MSTSSSPSSSFPSGSNPVSEKRARASRVNGAKSSGPRTPEGKARSSMNAVRHGLTAQSAVLPGEDRAALDELSRGLLAQLRPADPLQRVLAERVVALTWKLRRVAAAEARAAEEMDERALRSWEGDRRLHREMPALMPEAGPRPVPRDGATLLADSFREMGFNSERAVDGRLLRITQYELKLDAALRAAVRELRALKKEEQNFGTEPEEESGEAEAENVAPEVAAEVAPEVAPHAETAEAAPHGATECHTVPQFPVHDSNGQNEPEAGRAATDSGPDPTAVT